MSKEHLLALCLVIVVGTVIVIAFELLREWLGSESAKIKDRLAPRQAAPTGAAPSVISEFASDSRFGVLTRIRERLARIYPHDVARRLIKLGLALSITCAIAAYFFTGSLYLALAASVVALIIPAAAAHARYKRMQRQISEQLPEALDFIVRVVRAGHSLPIALQMCGEEVPDPLGREFRWCYDRHCVGQPLEDAMKEMAARIGTMDLSFMVSAALIHRETGGDLAEVLRGISKVMRSRVRIQQHVHAITAEGRFVGYILTALPFVFFGMMCIINPQYGGTLINTDQGRDLVKLAITLQVVGWFLIRRIVAIKF